ncbi:DUF4230 domain-containing protein [Ascidiimonas sp. W6]|uniref:DUF4230 domain-containing protein n=1 Tax=Ascidiimonas meishanensis TaxID=3128903 RepID=UPI0030EC942C
MEDLLIAFLGLLLGAIFMYWIFSLFRKRQNKELTEKQSVILLEKIRTVCKLITVEGEFAEIFHYENTKVHFMNLFISKKKALIIINAKTHIGFDMKKIEMHANLAKKTIIVTSFPQPEVITIEPDLKYYDIKDGLFNRFASEDLTALNKEAKKHILDKIPESSLMDTAKKEALEAILLMENIVGTIGWKLDYSALTIDPKSKKILSEE